jgi:hypothetical protein
VTAELPNPDLLLMEILRAGLSDAHTVGTEIPATMLDRLPFVMGRRVAGGAIDPRFLDRGVFDIQNWASTRLLAYQTAQAVRTALYEAFHYQTVFASGHLCSFTEFEAPAELRERDTPDGVWRFQALYSLSFR